MLVIFSGLPGTGKSTLARVVAERLDAVYARAPACIGGRMEQATAP